MVGQHDKPDLIGHMRWIACYKNLKGDCQQTLIMDGVKNKSIRKFVEKEKNIQTDKRERRG